MPTAASAPRAQARNHLLRARQQSQKRISMHQRSSIFVTASLEACLGRDSEHRIPSFAADGDCGPDLCRHTSLCFLSVRRAPGPSSPFVGRTSDLTLEISRLKHVGAGALQPLSGLTSLEPFSSACPCRQAKPF